MENPIKMDDFGVPLFLERPIWLLDFGWQIYTSQRLLGCWLQTPFFDTRFVRIEKTGRSASHTWGHGLSRMYTCSVNMYFQCSNQVCFWQTCLHIQHSLWPQISILYTQWNKVCPQFLYHQSSGMDKILVIIKYQTIFSSKLMVISNHDLFFSRIFRSSWPYLELIHQGLVASLYKSSCQD